MTTHVDLWPVAQETDVRFLSKILHITTSENILDSGDNWLADMLDIAAQAESWDSHHWHFIFDQIRLWRKEYLPGATFWQRASTRALERINECFKKEA